MVPCVGAGYMTWFLMWVLGVWDRCYMSCDAVPCVGAACVVWVLHLWYGPLCGYRMSCGVVPYMGTGHMMCDERHAVASYKRAPKI